MHLCSSVGAGCQSCSNIQRFLVFFCLNINQIFSITMFMYTDVLNSHGIAFMLAEIGTKGSLL